jgi:hypothetical protein
MIDADRLLIDTKKQVVALIEDLRTVVATDFDAAAHIATEYERAHAAGRTAFSRTEWAEGLYAQVAVAWVLGCVFVRFCEDNGLIEDPLLGGSGIRSQIALDHRAAHLRANPTDDDRQWLRAVFDRLRVLPATGEIFGPHNPVWADGFLPSADGARQLREELTRLDPDTGELRHDFTDPAWDTRFLGDLYQDLSEHAKKTYALLQTPVFVEEFILDRTLDPAIATFGLADTTVVDPTCGSGHFLLGAFARLFNRWVEAEPSTNRRELARRALDAIGGIDLNPFAASIARYRLLVAALRAGGDSKLADAPAYEIHIAVGDSLLHGDPPGRLPGMHMPDEEESLVANHGYESEDVEEVRALLAKSWTAVVGNPPYITVKDPALNSAYRARFSTCHRLYSLGVPFTERFWQLARADADSDRAGYVGMITANSFMKREFGKKLIEHWVPANDLTHVIDTSGAYLPGHGTPTVILLGRNRAPVASTVRAVMGIRGEPSRPTDPEKGLVWTSIVELVDDPGSQSEYVSISDLERIRLHSHPWSIGGGGAAELKDRLDSNTRRLESLVDHVGYTGQTNADEVFTFHSKSVPLRWGVESVLVRDLVVGEQVRDYAILHLEAAFVPYQRGELVDLDTYPCWKRILWPYRTTMWARATFSKLTYRQEGRPWYEWHLIRLGRLANANGLVFANVATHNHFVYDRLGRVLNPHAPAVKLAAGAGDGQYVELLGLLNSSTACFWMQQSFHNKGGPGGGSSKDEKWNDFYEHDGTKLRQLPLPASLPGATAAQLDRLAIDLAGATPNEVAERGVPTASALDEAHSAYKRIREEMISLQERLDWECYRLYGLIDEDLTTGSDPEPPLKLGERAFEILLARRLSAGEFETKWFSKFGGCPTVDLPSHWPPGYRQLVERRIDLIETDLNIGLLERPETKRRWESESWDELVEATLKTWLLDRLEERRYWPEPAAITTVARLTADARSDEDFISVARLYAGHDDVDLAVLIAELLKSESVAYLAAHRYTELGLRKHAEWLITWELQRREDTGEDVGSISVPPKYGKPDFNGAGWEHRGKLDVPKERFISYPGAERETDASMVVGWAGWNPLDRARALAAWYLQARRDGRDAAHVTPLLAGLAELVPWLKQWYDEPNPDPALDRPGTQIAALVETEMRSLGLIAQDFTTWRPEKKRSGRAKRAAT